MDGLRSNLLEFIQESMSEKVLESIAEYSIAESVQPSMAYILTAYAPELPLIIFITALLLALQDVEILHE